MKKFKKIIKTIFTYLYEVLIWFSFAWAMMLAVAFSYVLPKEGITVLVFAIIMASIDRLCKWIEHKEVNQP